MRLKGHPLVNVKAGPADGLKEGQFVAYASIFNNVDSYGDVVIPGAFTKTLDEWQNSGNVLPVLFGHNMFDPDYNIGGVEDAEEDARGLRIMSQLDLENPKAKNVWRGLKGRRFSQMSFAYDVMDAAPAEKDGREVYELRELKLWEVSVVTIGANQETEILAVKAAADVLAGGVKEGRVLSAKHVEALTAAHRSIGDVLAAADSSTGKARASGGTKGEDEGADSVKLSAPDVRRPSADPYLVDLELLALTPHE